MYTVENLSRYPYFAQLLKETELKNVLDSLTGLVSRAYVLGFVRDLIEKNIPFTFGIIDLDNFKFINDTYGHHIGDGVLQDVGESLIGYMDPVGIAGRFGGDELLVVNLRDQEYKDVKAFYEGMYSNFVVLRRNIPLQDCNPFITATVGSATFPKDATDYDTLFSMMDKTLYRGKTKGRNCYIIYVEEKHKNIEIKKIAKRGIYSTLQRINNLFEEKDSILDRLRNVAPVIMDELRTTELYYIGKKGVMRALMKPGMAENAMDVGNVFGTGEDCFIEEQVDLIACKAPIFHGALRNRESETAMIVRVNIEKENYGYLICAEPRSHRIWQEDECAMMFYLAKLTAARLRSTGESL